MNTLFFVLLTIDYLDTLQINHNYFHRELNEVLFYILVNIYYLISNYISINKNMYQTTNHVTTNQLFIKKMYHLTNHI